MFSEKYVERKLYRPTHLALLPMNAGHSLEGGETKEFRDKRGGRESFKTLNLRDYKS